MGRSRGKKGRSKKSRGPSRKDEIGDKYVVTVTENGNFRMEGYYAVQWFHNHYWNEQGELVPCQSTEEFEAERLRWRNSIAEVLPASFRIGKDVPPKLRDKMEAELAEIFGHMQDEKNDDDSDDIMKQLGFLPHAYQLALDRASIRRKPEHAQLHQWLKQQSQAGFITRQETVSMIPPVLLNPKPNDIVLDMCAAPGSKTSQLLEALNEHGCMVANDASFSRAHMLTHQIRRILHNNPVCLITHCNAQFFPAANQFDRILCDVPCSGDGTSRKNIDVWTSWSQLGALALHALQLDIAWKGAAQLLKVDGCICYSTCSFNPVENEAVVAELLRRSQGNLELLPVKLQEFRTRPGLSTWKVFCDDKTRREVRNKQKKDNEKMQQRRREWEERNQLRPLDGDSGGDNGDTTKLQDGDKIEANENGVDEGNSKQDSVLVEEAEPSETKSTEAAKQSSSLNRSTVIHKASDVRKFKPTSYDEETLVQLVESTGLNLYKSPADVPEHLQRRIRPSCFPPTEQEAAAFHLDRCIRCLPHDNDTGGFFVALLRKTGPLSAVDRKTMHAAATTAAAAATTTTTNLEKAESEEGREQAAKRAKLDLSVAEDAPADEELDDNQDGGGDDMELGGVGEDNKPFRGKSKRNLVRDEDGNAILELGRDDFVEVSDELLAPLIEFYGLAPTFERGLFMIRAGGESKVISYIAKPVKALFDAGLQKRVTVVTSGLKVLIRKGQDCAVNYRLSQEGIHFLAPHMTKRKFVVGRADFEACLTAEVVPFSKLSERLREQLSPLSVGSMVVVLEGYEEGDEKMILAKWRCRGAKVDNLVPKVELQAIKDKLHALESISNSI